MKPTRRRSAELFEDTSMSVINGWTRVARVGVSSGWTADATFGPTMPANMLLSQKGPDGKQYENFVIWTMDATKSWSRISAGPCKIAQMVGQILHGWCQHPKLLWLLWYCDWKDGEQVQGLGSKDGKSADEWAWINSFVTLDQNVSDDINSHIKHH